MLRSPSKIRQPLGCWGASGEQELGGHSSHIRYSSSGYLGREAGLWDLHDYEELRLLVQLAIWGGGPPDLEQNRGCIDSCRGLSGCSH